MIKPKSVLRQAHDEAFLDGMYIPVITRKKPEAASFKISLVVARLEL